MLPMAIDIVSYFFILGGVFFMFSGALGVMRMPEFFTRLHPASLNDSLGAPMVLIGVAIQNGMTLFSWKIILLVLFTFITGPTATHALAKAALFYGLKPLIKDKK
jgi:multicomponent Na+:H+ antiporter subunit G